VLPSVEVQEIPFLQQTLITLHHAFRPGALNQHLDNFQLNFKVTPEGFINGLSFTITPSAVNDAPTVRKLLFGEVNFPFAEQVVAAAMPPRKPISFDIPLQSPVLSDHKSLQSPDGNFYMLFPWATQRVVINKPQLNLYVQPQQPQQPGQQLH
jgi:hypothetical protein